MQLHGGITMTTIAEYLHDKGRDVVICVCMDCRSMTGIKAGCGTTGVSHGMCDKCMVLRRALKEATV
jgi:flagellar biosynthesis/type III secretory pathway ATPase